ncbi:MAG: hypothetical protein J1G38_05595 [Clostridiales bacterium]|nr:hypothetical protein [Clostridiales bacterium]
MERMCRQLHKKTSIALVLIALACFIFIGCAALPKLKLTTSEISLFVGDERDLALYALFEPAAADDRGFKVKSSDPCVAVRGTKIKAVSPGVATVTASNGESKAKMTVTVSYRAAQNLEMRAAGKTVMTVSDIEPITFSAYLDDFCDPDIEIEWTVNGKKQGVGGEYVFLPSGVGEFTVEASAGGLFAQRKILVYRETEAAGYGDGAFSQYRNFSPIRFYAVESKDYGNPQSVYVWTVNGQCKSSAPEFMFTPISLGTYEIELFVNGVKRDINGKSSAVVVASGDRAPSARVEFDDLGGVFVLWNDGGVARSVSIVNPNGDRTVYNSSDLRYSDLFGNGYFDASDFLSPCSVSPKSYTVTVTADAAGEPFTFMQYPLEAEEYVDKNIVCKNAFLSSEEQAADFIYELYANGARSAKGYLSREAAEHKTDIVAAAKQAAAELGITATVTVEGNILAAELSNYINTPTETEETSVRSLRIMIPHVETTDSKSLRSRDYVLSIERAQKSVEADNTEQLLIAVSNGVMPKLKEGSAAAHVYSAARTALFGIIGRNYTDSQKVHAIYDWLQVVTSRVKNAKIGSVSDFLEGVFGDGSSSASAVVSDLGAAKAVALLCGMEGIECETVADDGNHYNRVKLDGLWYNVDAFDGKAGVPGTDNEYCTHAGLFFADGAASDANSAYDGSLYYYLQKSTFDGIYYDCYLEKIDDEKTVGAAVFDAFSKQTRRIFEIHVPNGRTQYSNTDYGAEFALDKNLTEKERETARILIERAAADYIEGYVRDNYDGEDVEARVAAYVGTVHATEAGGIVWVTAQIPTFYAI